MGGLSSNSRGASNDFRFDFWDRAKATADQSYQIRCAIPDVDEDITARAGGEFTKEFAASAKSADRHLCFQASLQYNSWTCFDLSPRSGKLMASFARLNADQAGPARSSLACAAVRSFNSSTALP